MNSNKLELQSNNNEKIKVLWLCNFRNGTIQDIIKPYKKNKEVASWVSNLIQLFENNNDIELHIVSQHYWISNIKMFKHKGVFYHIINRGIPFIGRPWPSFFQFPLWTDSFFLIKRISSIVDRVKPDIIHQHGAENEFACGIQQFNNKYPVFVTLQGFLHKVASNKDDLRTRRRVKRELKIYRTFKHFGYRTRTMKEVVKELNPEAIFHWHGYAMNVIQKKIANKIKEYDIVFFAKITKLKGIEDLLHAIKLIKENNRNISALIIGKANDEYLDYLKKLCKSLNIERNITWTGFLTSQDDVFEAASTARISVLPTHYDMIPGTIIESMFLKLAVVAYNTGSIHEVNDKEEVIKLIEKGNINELAVSITNLLDDENLRKEKIQKGFDRAIEMFDNSKIKTDLLKAYREVIDDFNK